MWAIKKNLILQTKDFSNIFEHIKSIFKMEQKSSYYIPSNSFYSVDPATNKKFKKQISPTGKLYNAWKHHIELARKDAYADNADVYYRRKKNIENKVSAVEPQEEQLELKKWLTVNFEPWSAIISNWKKTTSLRALHLRDKSKDFDWVIQEWPRYRSRMGGYDLIDIDFDHFYPEKDTMKELWPKCREIIIELANKKARQPPKNKAMIERLALQSEKDDDGKNFEGILAIHSLFYLLPNKNSSTKKSLEKILVQAEPGAKVQDIVDEISKKDVANKNFNPTIIYYNNDDHIPYKFYVVVNDVMYETQNIVTAVDIFFKIYFVFNLQYPDECKNLLVFIQGFFYNIYLEGDFRSSKLLDLMTDIDYERGTQFSERVLSKLYDN